MAHAWAIEKLLSGFTLLFVGSSSNTKVCTMRGSATFFARRFRLNFYLAISSAFCSIAAGQVHAQERVNTRQIAQIGSVLPSSQLRNWTPADSIRMRRVLQHQGDSWVADTDVEGSSFSPFKVSPDG